MKETAVVLLLVLVIVSAEVGYLAGSASERVVTSVSTSTATTTAFEQMGIMIENASFPASAWSYSNSGGNLLQCGYAQPTGSGSITLNNTGTIPIGVDGLTIFLSRFGSNQTEYLATPGQPHTQQSCTISPSGSLTIYFTLYGPTPTHCDPFTAYVSLSTGYELGFLGEVGSGCPSA